MDAIKFIRVPKEELSNDETIYKTILEFTLIFLMCFGLSVISLFITEFLRNLELIPSYTREWSDATKKVRDNILYAAVMFPILEEIAFRLYLKRTVLNVFVSVLFMAYMISSAFIFKTSHFSLENYGLPRIFLSISVALIALFIYKKRVFSLKFKHLYYLSALLFGLVHIYNYDYTNTEVLIFVVAICMPQIISGLFLGYVRIKYGIIGAIILHGLLNGLPSFIV